MKVSKQSIVIAVIFLGCLGYAYFFKKDYRIGLKQKGTEIVVGQITREYTPPRSSGYLIDFSYSYEGKKINGSRNIHGIITSPWRFVDKFFPVVVSKEDPHECAILITPQDFSFFNKQFPDSLSWAIQWVHDENN